MTIILFLVDTSSSMNQRTYLGARPTLLDVAKDAVEKFLKVIFWVFLPCLFSTLIFMSFQKKQKLSAKLLVTFYILYLLLRLVGLVPLPLALCSFVKEIPHLVVTDTCYLHLKIHQQTLRYVQTGREEDV